MKPHRMQVTAASESELRHVRPGADCVADYLVRWRVTIPLFFFDYFDGQQLHEAEDGVELRDADAAYLEAFKAASEIWGEALRGRRNPEFDAFRIRDTTGVVVLELPFAEVLESTRGPTRTLRRNAADPPPLRRSK
jgi:hypothetical protein